MTDRRRQEVIDKWFGGSSERYEKEMAELNARVVEESFGGDKAEADADRRRGRQETIHWQDIVDAASILPDLNESVRDLIYRRLGYLPHDSVLLEQEPFLRALFKNHQQGLLTDNDFTEQVDAQIKLLRNQDLQQGGWVVSQELSAEDYDRYENELPAYKQAAHDRVVDFLGYEPELLYSLEAEIRLRRLMTYDEFHLGDTITQLDVKVLTIIFYREIYFEDGQEEADAMPLLGSEAKSVIRHRAG